MDNPAVRGGCRTARLTRLVSKALKIKEPDYISVPVDYQEAIINPDKKSWKLAFLDELKQLEH